MIKEVGAIRFDRIETHSGGRPSGKTAGNNGGGRPSGKIAGNSGSGERGGDIDPDEVGAFEGHNAPEREVFCDEIAERSVVVVDIDVER